MTGALAAVAVIVSATVFGLIWRRRSGVLKVRKAPQDVGVRQDLHRDAPQHRDSTARDVVTAAELDTELGERATLLQFSSAFCAPCRATRVVLADVAATVEGVAHVEIDAESRLELVRRLGILRTPTVLVLDARGRIAARGAGRPRKADVIAALGTAIGL